MFGSLFVSWCESLSLGLYAFRVLSISTPGFVFFFFVGDLISPQWNWQRASFTLIKENNHWPARTVSVRLLWIGALCAKWDMDFRGRTSWPEMK